MAGVPGSDDMMKLVAEMEATAAALAEADKELRAATYTGCSKDRSVEVTVGAQGELKQVKFLADRHRSMSSEELGAAVLEAAQRGRAHMAQSVLDAFQPLTQRSAMLGRPDEARAGVDWAKMFQPFEQAVAIGGTAREKRKSRLRDEIVEDPET
ncbi:YbaB/EbfC family nucleoid-associated protein [Streptomyces sp. NPDC050848]|uniref:YbaB/EbfC family nucleoid-associated protein n=1 Tax=Streptomyces sp. NPDC050848 TaxID=3155791 RepID=UPI0033CB9E19